MSGTSFKTDIYLRGGYFSSKYEVKDKIKENQKYIQMSIEKLKMFVSANPKDIIDPEWKEEPINWLSNQIDDLIETIEEFSQENFRLYLYLNYIDEEHGGVIPKITIDDL